MHKYKYQLTNKANFYIRLSALIMLILFLIIDLISAIYFPVEKFKMLGYSERVGTYYAYFTTESNYMVVIYFCVYLFNNHFRNSKPSFQMRLAVTVYITITMLVFWIGIFTSEQDAKQYSVYNWISTLILHLILPIIMITSFIITSGEEIINLKHQHKIYLWLIAIYPLIYCIIILIRGHLRYLDWLAHGGTINSLPPRNTWYPYFFFDYANGPYGWLIAAAAIIFIFGLVFGLQYFYIFINNKMFHLQQTPEHRLHEFYRQVLRRINKITKRKNNKEDINNNYDDTNSITNKLPSGPKSAGSKPKSNETKKVAKSKPEKEE